MKQVLLAILSAALFAVPALADEPAAAAPAPAAAKPAEVQADAKPCDGKKGDCPDCAEHGGRGEHGGCCADDDDDDDCDDCCGGAKGDGKPGEAKPCDGKDCEGKKGECPDCDGKKPDGDKGDGEHHRRGGGFGGGFWRGWAAILQPHALLQTQVGLYAGADNQMARGDVVESAGNFILRRARLGVGGHISERITWALSTDFADIAKGASPIHDANASLHFLKHQDLTVGAQLVPFSRFAMLGSGDQALAQRPKAADAMAPFHQIGASLHGHYDIGGIQWWAGAYNSFERNVNYFGGIDNNSWLFLGAAGNRARGYSVAGRIQAEPFGPLGDEAASRGMKDKFRLEVGAGGYYNDAGGTTSWAGSADIHIKSHGAHLLVEYLMDSASPKTAPTVASTIPDTIKRNALIAELGYTWWRFNAAARVELIDPNTAIKDNHDETIISGAIGAQLTKNRARVQLQFDHRIESVTPALANDTLFAQFQVKL